MENLQTIKKVYQHAENYELLDIPRLAEDLHDWFLRYPHNNFLHLCVIQGQAALVCQSSLSQESPQAYVALLKICHKYFIFLKQNQRTQDTLQTQNRRSQKIALLGFCLGLMSNPAVARSTESHAIHRQHISSHRIALTEQMSTRVKLVNGQKAISFRKQAPPSAQQIAEAYQIKPLRQPVKHAANLKIKDFLRKSYVAQTGDPASIRKDLQEIAHYYAQYPAIVNLVSELSGHNIILKYKKNHWQAQALGTQTSVDQVTVYFDTRIGAQLWLHEKCAESPACHVTPADALLHELLHAKLMIVDSHEFIQKGGMKPALYLYDHEAEVIAYENRLYQTMSAADGMPRPLRSRHSGNLKHVSCALCLPKKAPPTY